MTIIRSRRPSVTSTQSGVDEIERRSLHGARVQLGGHGTGVSTSIGYGGYHSAHRAARSRSRVIAGSRYSSQSRETSPFGRVMAGNGQRRHGAVS